MPKPFGKSFWQSVRAPFVAVKCRICYIPVPAGPRAAAAAALTFRASADASAHYTVNVDAARAGQAVAAGPGRRRVPDADRARPDLPPEGGGRRFTHQVFLDGDTTPVIDVCDGTYAGGRFGVNVFDAVGEAQDLTLS